MKRKSNMYSLFTKFCDIGFLFFIESFINMVAIEEVGSESEKRNAQKILANNNYC